MTSHLRMICGGKRFNIQLYFLYLPTMLTYVHVSGEDDLTSYCFFVLDGIETCWVN